MAFKSDATWNDAHWYRPGCDKLIIEARGCLDPIKRKELYGEIQRMIHEDGGYIIPVFPHYLDAGSKKAHIKLHPLASLGGWNFAEEAWIES